jgi:Class III cytochrome C family
MVMNKKLLIWGIVGFAVLYLSGAIYAKEVPAVIDLNDPAYKEHDKGIVHFEHLKHQTEYAKKYPQFYKNGCGECHHDENNKPLTGLKAGDDVKKCIECHKIPGEMPAKIKKELRAQKASKEEIKKKELEYQAEAMHEDCTSCHRLFNKEVKPKKKAPTTCASCHPKK